MRLALVLALAGVAAVGVLAGMPGLIRSADTGTGIVGAGIALGILSALAPSPRRPEPLAYRRRVAR